MIEQNLKLKAGVRPLLPDPSRYRRLVGRLLYLTITRPYIIYFVNVLNQFMSQPPESHRKAALRVVHYIKSSSRTNILLSSTNLLKLHAYCDSDWPSCPMTIWSITCYCIFLGNFSISWTSKEGLSDDCCIWVSICGIYNMWNHIGELSTCWSMCSILHCDFIPCQSGGHSHCFEPRLPWANNAH